MQKPQMMSAQACGGQGAEGAGAGRSKSKIPVAGFTYQMEWLKGQELKDRINFPGYCSWSQWTVQGEDGRFHLFGDRWKGDPSGYHVNGSELTHFVADQPEGPYRFLGSPLMPGGPGEWDESCFYPCVQKHGDGWAMMYNGLRRTGLIKDKKIASMCGGVAVADSIHGPWRKIGKVLEPSVDPKHWTCDGTLGIHVPCFISFRGRWYAYFKGGSYVQDGIRVNRDFMGVAVADGPMGPYRIMDQPCILKNGQQVGGYIEDMCPFVWEDRMYLMVDDNFGVVSGVEGGILLFESDDGLAFPYDKARLAVDLIPAYYSGWDPTRAKFHWSRSAKFDAPRLLWIDGRPAYFVGSCAANITGGDAPCSHYWLKILKWNCASDGERRH